MGSHRAAIANPDPFVFEQEQTEQAMAKEDHIGKCIMAAVQQDFHAMTI